VILLIEDMGVRDSVGESAVCSVLREGSYGGQDLRVALNTAREIASARAENERSREILKDLFFLLGHELREPVRMLAVHGELLSQESDNGQRANAISFMRRAAEQVRTLSERLLSYLEASHGKKQTTIRAEDELRETLFDLENALRTANVNVVTESRLPEVVGEPGALARVFRELLHNSIRFRSGSEGSVVIRSSVGAKGWVQFEVIDSGIGFDPRLARKIFQAGSKLHGRERSGAGIGLALARRIVERHGGSISATSQEGKGTSVCFTWPDI
jgi:signal transduction histidine kinase